MPSCSPAVFALAKSRDAIAVISLHWPFCIPGITFRVAMDATPSTPHFTFLFIRHALQERAFPIRPQKPAGTILHETLSRCLALLLIDSPGKCGSRFATRRTDSFAGVVGEFRGFGRFPLCYEPQVELGQQQQTYRTIRIAADRFQKVFFSTDD